MRMNFHSRFHSLVEVGLVYTVRANMRNYWYQGITHMHIAIVIGA